MSRLRESLIADLATETGLPDREIRLFLNALAVKMNEEIRSSNQFDLPGVGKLMRLPEIATGPEYQDGIVVTEFDLGQPRRAGGLEIEPVRIPVPEQRTGHPPAIAEVVDDTEVPRRLVGYFPRAVQLAGLRGCVRVHPSGKPAGCGAGPA